MRPSGKEPLLFQGYYLQKVKKSTVPENDDDAPDVHKVSQKIHQQVNAQKRLAKRLDNRLEDNNNNNNDVSVETTENRYPRRDRKQMEFFDFEAEKRKEKEQKSAKDIFNLPNLVSIGDGHYRSDDDSEEEPTPAPAPVPVAPAPVPVAPAPVAPAPVAPKKRYTYVYKPPVPVANTLTEAMNQPHSRV
jgi:hypothetical protein